MPDFLYTERFALLCVGAALAALSSFLMSNAERRPPEVYLRINNAILAGLSAAAVCAILVEQSIFGEGLIPAYCALIGLMADARTWRMVGGQWLTDFAQRHGFSVPDKYKAALKKRSGGDGQPVEPTGSDKGADGR